MIKGSYLIGGIITAIITSAILTILGQVFPDFGLFLLMVVASVCCLSFVAAVLSENVNAWFICWFIVGFGVVLAWN